MPAPEFGQLVTLPGAPEAENRRGGPGLRAWDTEPSTPPALELAGPGGCGSGPQKAKGLAASSPALRNAEATGSMHPKEWRSVPFPRWCERGGPRRGPGKERVNRARAFDPPPGRSQVTSPHCRSGGTGGDCRGGRGDGGGGGVPRRASLPAPLPACLKGLQKNVNRLPAVTLRTQSIHRKRTD